MTRTIELDEARTLLRKAMETQGPDFVYNGDRYDDSGCHYTPMIDGPASKRITGCLVGVALDLAGVTFHHQPAYVCVTIDRLAVHMDELTGVTLSPDAVTYWMVAQRGQDTGYSWGAAYEEAEGVAEALTEAGM